MRYRFTHNRMGQDGSKFVEWKDARRAWRKEDNDKESIKLDRCIRAVVEAVEDSGNKWKHPTWQGQIRNPDHCKDYEQWKSGSGVRGGYVYLRGPYAGLVAHFLLESKGSFYVDDRVGVY